MTTRRQFNSRLTTLALLSATLPRWAAAQQSDVVRVLVGFPPGGSGDTLARRLIERLRGNYGSTVIVENKPGAGGQIAVSALNAAAPDGNTLLLTPPAPITVYPFTYKSLPYRPDDAQPVSLVCNFSFGFAVGPAVPESVRTLKDFMDWARVTPAKAMFGSPAAGSTPHLLGSMLAKAAGVELTHVPYRGDGPGLQDLLGGQVAGYSTVLGSYMPHLKSDRLRLLGVSSATRSAIVPDVPTYREQGIALDMMEWMGVFAPKGTPAPVVQRIAGAVQAAVAHPEFAKGLAEFGMTPRSSTPQVFAEQLRVETEMWRVEIKKLGFTAES
ncbi:Bug family tripartite tricarboxylate transporter substrate binding protein [Piscinibacter sp.]|uniref:Bug family tripartite tricarboxylate transporter substrate binding protein n=1 Tax=Piscinibacter sp. TaxID=1903157 RepID=UPI002CB9BC9F|nr:Bug family tripartite tricarboxylate transporter substrate binding protein [Albitalea sp.]HUG21795.1 Bug family tripartite tricarboxylate transporter substrate binding protein [Albitalea sp.]